MAAVARLLSRSKPYQVPGKLLVTEHWFEVPLDYTKPDATKIRLFARSAIRFERPIVPDTKPESRQKPFLLFLEGGPGFGNAAPQDSTLSSHMLDRGYELLLLDYRGVGLSSTISARQLRGLGGPREQAEYLAHFRADNIVRDSEAVRRCLTADYAEEKKRWSIFGQSFGGFTSLTYLSFHPEGLRESFITGGLAPLDKTPDEFYARTYERAMDRNRAYYNKFPGDVAVVKELIAKIRAMAGTEGVRMPGGGTLTVGRFLCQGLAFGMDGGLDKVHNLVVRMKGDLDQAGFFSRLTLNLLEQSPDWDVAPIYTLLHEPCTANGPGAVTNWAAHRVGKGLAQFAWLRDDWAGPESMAADEPVFFSGEMVYPHLFDSCSELVPLKETVDILAKHEWPALYDVEQLGKNEVPVYAAVYNDMYVDVGFSRETAAKIRGIKTWESNVHFHGAVRQKPGDVFPQLLKLRNDTID